jgi:hypothetical protein
VQAAAEVKAGSKAQLILDSIGLIVPIVRLCSSGSSVDNNMLGPWLLLSCFCGVKSNVGISVHFKPSLAGFGLRVRLFAILAYHYFCQQWHSHVHISAKGVPCCPVVAVVLHRRVTLVWHFVTAQTLPVNLNHSVSVCGACCLPGGSTVLCITLCCVLVCLDLRCTYSVAAKV